MMAMRRVALLAMLAGCGQVIGIRDLGVEAPPSNVDGGPSLPNGTPDADSGHHVTNLDAGSDAMTCSRPDVAGHWSGTFTTSTGGGSFGGALTASAEADVQQDCTFITGSIAIAGCLPDGGKLLATIDDSGALDGTLTAGTNTATLRATLASPSQLQGSFTNIRNGSNCYVPSGAFQMDRD